MTVSISVQKKLMMDSKFHLLLSGRWPGPLKNQFLESFYKDDLSPSLSFGSINIHCPVHMWRRGVRRDYTLIRRLSVKRFQGSVKLVLSILPEQSGVVWFISVRFH